MQSSGGRASALTEPIYQVDGESFYEPCGFFPVEGSEMLEYRME